MDNYIENIQQNRKSLTSVMKKYDITVEDIRDVVYGSKTKITGINLEFFKLHDYTIVIGDFITGVSYEKDSKDYYMMISANSFYANPRQIAIGTSYQDNIYMMIESFPSREIIELVSFPKSSINKDTKGFIPKSFRKTVNLQSLDINLADENIKKCLECGFNASNVFCELVNEIEVKRKKLKR